MPRTRHTLISTALLFLVPLFSHAAQLKRFSDTISTSVPGANAAHDIVFTPTNPIPAGGEIHVRFDGNGAPFVFDPTFSFGNLGLTVGGTPYVFDVAQDLATSTASLLQNGDGEIAIMLPTDPSFAIPAGTQVELQVGAGTSSETAILNPTTDGMQRYTIITMDAAENEIDRGVGVDFMVEPTTMGAISLGREAILSKGMPGGLLPGGTKAVVVSVDTDLPAYCRYSLTPGMEFDQMSPLNSFKDYNFMEHHELLVSLKDDTSYAYYVRCFTKYGLTANTKDYPITFDVGIVPKEIHPPPPPPGTQEGNHSGGGNGLPQSGLGISGRTFPSGKVVILKDGKDYRTLSADSTGGFSMTDSGFDRGTYGFNIVASDANGLMTANYTTTMALSASTYNTIGPVMMSPTLTSKTSRIDNGQPLFVTGSAIPNTLLQLVVLTSMDPLQSPLLISTTTVNGSGQWSMSVPTGSLTKGSYSIRAQTLGTAGSSLFSPEFLLGVGQAAQGDVRKRADLNHDGKINFADFSILLFSWKKASPVADINGDGIVDLKDLSIMLSAWTG